MSEIEAKEEKLQKMEKELQRRCEDFDKEKVQFVTDKDAFEQQEQQLKKDRDELTKTIGQLNSSERFRKIQELLDEVYTLYVTSGGKEADLIEAIRLVLEARAKFP
jgi:vacuolar-type H+-ATPase subunit E/Vma4